MLMYEMYGVAQDNNKTYESPYAEYNSIKGFSIKEPGNTMSRTDLLEAMCNENCWKIKDDRKEMSLEEIEKELGYKIKLKTNNDKYSEAKDILRFFGF